ncbi:uncharacterized protein [Lolium perenne]|jgi:uncharacterized protein (TIGR01568 family)|uniref:uncharacterized protein n=1 Tax=Lolium perenne TaxID=4522 RepID=UPI0021EA11F1|nr:uncharacterized protein LOC127294894 [Lolium perenne]
MPASSWFHKLRRKRRKGRPSGACPSPSPIHGAAADEPIAVVTTTVASTDDQRTQQRQRPIAEPRSPAGPAPAPCAGYSPNRPSYYFPTADRAARPDGGLRCIAPRGGDDDSTVLDVRVDVVHRRAGRLGGIDAPPATPELNLRRIVTRPLAKNEPAGDVPGSSGSTTTSAATTPSTCRARGFHVRPASTRTRRRRRRGHDDDNNNVRKHKDKAVEAAPAHVGSTTTTRGRRWLYESLVVVKTSSDPEREMAESMAEMVAANHIRSSDDLQELLACYLALNAAEHHRAVVAAFRRVWLHIASQRLLHHPRH